MPVCSLTGESVLFVKKGMAQAGYLHAKWDSFNILCIAKILQHIVQFINRFVEAASSLPELHSIRVSDKHQVGFQEKSFVVR